MVEGWQEAAAKIGFARALENAIDLTKEQYEKRHDGFERRESPMRPAASSWWSASGARTTGDVLDIGIEYYRYVPQAGEIANAAE